MNLPLLLSPICDLRSEARHYQDYLSLAQQVAGGNIQDSVSFFGELEAKLIQSQDDTFLFHSGVPAIR